MNPFHYAKSFFSDDYLPQQLTWAFGLFLLSLVMVMAGLVLIRRAFGVPRRSSTGTPPPPGLTVFERYEIGARLWHVGLVGSFWLSGSRALRSTLPDHSWPGARAGHVLAFVHLAFGSCSSSVSCSI
jgi:hypothetical protein